ncbi:MAG: ABC transporter permease [Ruminococcaceae bacterium]|nr:ABC transporter permease [Oscillospiraceae bacterium]
MIQIVKRPDPSKTQDLLTRLFAVLCALVCASLLMAALGYNPFKVFGNIFIGSTGTLHRIRETIIKTIPLAALSLGVAVAFKMKFWNIGAEGQFYMGAMAAAWVAFNFNRLPMILMLPFMFCAAMLFGGLWALIPAFLKSKFKTSEILVTLMLNYVAVKWITYLQYGPWKDPKAAGFAKMPKFVNAAVLPKVFGVHIGWIIVLVLAVLVHILLNKTKFGYQVSVIGESEYTARYAGISVAKITLIAVIIGGGLCGVAGFMQASAIEHSLTDQLSAGLGFTSVITAWLARLSAPAIIVVSFLFAALLQGSAYIQTAMQIPAAVAEVLQGIILFFVLGSEFFLNYKLVFHKNAKEAA